MTEPEYPVYEKNGQTQIAPNAEAEIRLRFNGWRKQHAETTDPPSVDPPAPAARATPAETPRERSKPRNKSADQ